MRVYMFRTPGLTARHPRCTFTLRRMRLGATPTATGAPSADGECAQA